MQGPAQVHELFFLHPQLGEVELEGLFIEDAQHHPFAMPGRDGRDTHVHRPPRDAQADPSVLRQALLCDVQS